MDVSAIVNMISTVGFPIVMCVIMFKYLEKTDDKREQDTRQILESVNNNTQVIAKLVDKLEDIGKNG